MNVIDLEILIPASPEFIWRFLGDPAALPRWQEDVTSVSFLSTQRDGQGTRWRASSEKSNDIVVEVSAWYDTLGYEYRLMDGASFAENQGRLRLHEVADGTLVRWTFQYELSGVFGGLRNAMRLKRSTTNQLQASLRNLHQLILKESGGISTHEAKASVREAPDVDERLSYQPRHPSAFYEAAGDELAEGDTESATDKQPAFRELVLAEPLPSVAETDTKPNPVVLSVADDEALLATPPVAPDDTKPMKVFPPPVAAPERPAPAPLPPEPPPTPERRAPEPDPEPLVMPARPAPRDSADLSVFEIFGLKKPSESNSWSAPVESPLRVERDSKPPILHTPPGRPETAPRLESPPEAAAPGAGDGIGIVLGWRRRSRRRRPPIRSHN